jgi:hypothetical protein
MTIVGAFAFGDFIFEPWNATGLAVSMAGAVWYAMRSALRVRQQRCHLEGLVGVKGVLTHIAACFLLLIFHLAFRLPGPTLLTPQPLCRHARSP